MSDYIRREDALMAVCRADLPDKTEDGTPILNGKRKVSDCVRRIKAIPAADVVERKHGKWIYQFHEDEVGATCSECEGYAESFAKWIYDDGYRINYNYCPSCGADMREES